MAFANNPRVVSTRKSGLLPEIFHGAEAATQSFKSGELVYLNNGLVTICGADPTLILGIAQSDASGTTSAAMKVQVISGEDIVNIRVRTAATDATSDNVELGTRYGLINASNVWYLDYAEVTTNSVIPYAHNLDAAGAYTYWVQVRFLPAVLQFDIGQAG